MRFSPGPYQLPGLLAAKIHKIKEAHALRAALTGYIDDYRKQGPALGAYWGDTATPHLYFLTMMYHVATNDRPSSALSRTAITNAVGHEEVFPPFAGWTNAQKQRFAEWYIIAASVIGDEWEHGVSAHDARRIAAAQAAARQALLSDEDIDPRTVKMDRLPCYLDHYTGVLARQSAPVCDQYMQTKYAEVTTGTIYDFRLLWTPTR